MKCLIEGILEAGIELEKKNCVHRDVKPDNFLFIPADFTIKICDFGESVNYQNMNTITLDKLTILNKVGTTLFMSPEMIKIN